MIQSKRARKRIVHFIVHVVLIVTCILFLVPIIYTLKISISPSNSLVNIDFSLIPKDATLDNYKEVLFSPDVPFFLWLKNSLILSVSTVIFTLAVASPAAYAYSRLRFRLRNSTLYMLLLLNAFPAILSIAAIYRFLRITGLFNTYTGLILAYIGLMIIFGIWILKGYFDSIPVEIEQAAVIDGANSLQLLWRIVLPLARPAIIVAAMMIFITAWNEYVFAINFFSTNNHYTLAVGLYSLGSANFSTNWPLFTAASLIVTFPVLVVFFAIQKYMVSGLTLGGVKF